MGRLLLLASILLLGGCASLGYYAQSIRGQIGVMAASRPIEDVVADQRTAEQVRLRLAQLPALRRFATEQLGLSGSDSYTLYADVQREALVWSVVATPVDSLQAHEWCYPFIGCASYRGYFDPQSAHSYAATLAADGWDVAVQPVPAYSTLGWFSDPLPSTVVDWPLPDIAGLVFHELAHQTLYVAGDSAFNEAYATVIEQEGVRRWLQRHGDSRQRCERAQRERRRLEFLQLLGRTRQRLESVYASQSARADMLRRKHTAFAALRDEYQLLKQAWGGYSGYDRWFERPLNNAHLAAADTYHALEPAFRALLARVGGDMSAFHAICRQIAALDESPRQAYMDRLLDTGRPVLQPLAPMVTR